VEYLIDDDDDFFFLEMNIDGAGPMRQVACTPGQQVDAGDLLVAVEPV
jgi:acetyl/propionyl-CoA carboxylase alpha subunit